jgi:hypothetical protein
MSARVLILLVGAGLLIAGVIGLLVPVSASSNGESVSCGNAVASNTSEAEKKDQNLGNTAADVASSVGLPQVGSQIPQTHFLDACNSALSTRRAWTIPLAVIGLVLTGGALLLGDRLGGRRVAASGFSAGR